MGSLTVCIVAKVTFLNKKNDHKLLTNDWVWYDYYIIMVLFILQSIAVWKVLETATSFLTPVKIFNLKHQFGRVCYSNRKYFYYT